SPMESENRSRSVDDLPQMPRKRSEAPLFFRSRARRRPRTLAKTRADQGTPHRTNYSRRKVDPPKSKVRRNGSDVAGSGSAVRFDDLERRRTLPTAPV